MDLKSFACSAGTTTNLINLKLKFPNFRTPRKYPHNSVCSEPMKSSWNHLFRALCHAKHANYNEMCESGEQAYAFALLEI
ncbi:hypothetical protein CEXT_243451 [Caerostris extrusa]|uniref:Uncharacterized protein n=1 Tax=Caerostris extrusa TaxID=172846 RepID=A0AAV4SXC1_CAEEX|nr:hypothetical protein CEXT_243451 [Caerostris extrusa]